MPGNTLPRAVLFACSLNTVRSPMAEALTRFLFGQAMRVESAGLRAGEPDGFAIVAMHEAGLDLMSHMPRTLEDIERFDFDLVVTLSPEAHHKVLEFVRGIEVDVEYWPTKDATGIEGDRDQKLEAYRAVRDRLKARIKQRFAGAPSGALEMGEQSAGLWLGVFAGGAQGRREALLAFCATRLHIGRERLTLAHDRLGAPLLELDGKASGWLVSSSSRENIALFGLSREKIGVDLELVTSLAPAWNVLHGSEKAVLAALPVERQGEAFLRFWAAKEAYLKALGLGLRREPSEIRIAVEGDSFSIFDAERRVVANEARHVRATVEGRACLCACVTLPER
jgi:protein-tyrosine-phosphatase/phosphopantetheinyl transferase